MMRKEMVMMVCTMMVVSKSMLVVMGMVMMNNG